MPTRALLAVLFLCPLTLFAAGNKYNHVTHGPILGRLSARGVGVWARTLRTGSFGVRYGISPDRLDRVTAPVPTRLAHDNTGWVHITGLAPDTKYYYRLFIPQQPGLTGRSGSFRTLPDTKALVNPKLNPRGLFNFQVGVLRYSTRLDAWFIGLVDEYPPFRIYS